MALYVGIALGVLAFAGIAVWGWKAYAKSQKGRGQDQTKREILEEMARRDRNAELAETGPIPLDTADQLKRLRTLQERLRRRRDKTLSHDDV